MCYINLNTTNKGGTVMAIVGIDLGTTNSLVGVWKDNECILIPNSFGSILTPSVVSILEDGEICVGEIAKQRLVSHPEVTVGSFKRFMGTKKRITLGKKEYSPIELSSFVIRKLINDASNYLGEEISEAVVSVPAYFGDAQRSATKLAGELAGVKVDRIINEPSAAALSTGLAKERTELCLVFDFGGGTLDVSLVDMFENIVEIIAVSGDNQLGGNDFDEILANEFINVSGLGNFSLSKNEIASIKNRIEEAKKKLSTEKEVVVSYVYNEKQYQFTFTNEILIEVCDSILTRIKKTIDQVIIDAKVTLEDIENVIMVGGSSNMKIVQLYLKHLLKKTPFIPEECDLAIARGCAMVAGIKQRDESIKDIVLTDICPFSLGVGVHNEKNPNNPLFSTIIPRNTVLPSSRVGVYTTIYNNQKKIRLGVFQGESMYTNDNEELGELNVDVRSKPAGDESIVVTFTYDINGILVVDVVVSSTKKTYHQVFMNEKTGLAQKEIDAILANLEEIKDKKDEDIEQANLIVARVERLFFEYPQFRDQLSYYLAYYRKVCNRGIKSIIEKRTAEFSHFLDEIENSSWGISEFDIDDFRKSILEDLDDDFDPEKMN